MRRGSAPPDPRRRRPCPGQRALAWHSPTLQWTMGSMRLFVALTPPEDVRSGLAAHLSPRTEVAGGPRWTDPVQWHLTLAFMPAVEDWRLDGLLDRLTGVADRHPVLRLGLDAAGALPVPERATVLYVGVSDPSDRLPPLVRSVRGACNAEGARPGGRRFTPHLTVARFRRPCEATRWIRVLEPVPSLEWTADRLELIRSHLGQGRGRRPRYEVVETFALGAAE
jgi:2'-5' RNA ligase